MNKHLILISGEAATGKTGGLMFLNDHPGVFYANCDNGKELPFASKFKTKVITDPLKLPVYLDKAEKDEKIHTCVVDTITYLMEQYRIKYINTAKNAQKAWGGYADYFVNLMNDTVGPMTKNVIMLGHTATITNEDTGKTKTQVRVQGGLMNNGIESRFTNVISTKRLPLKDLEDYENDLLNITEEDEALGFKYVYQTKNTKDTVNEVIRSPMGMWSLKETFIDNNAQFVLDRLHEFYN